MKKIIYSLALIFVAISISAQNNAIKFEEGTWAEIVAKAQKENKPIFLDAYAVWCGPCKWMAANVFTNKDVAEYFNTKFINAKIDMEKGEGVKLAQRFQVQAYPTLLIINSGGEVLHRACGALQAGEFIKWATESFDVENRFAALQTKYENGERSSEFMLKYIETLDKACINAEKVAEEYLNSLKDEALYEKNNWSIFNSHIWNSESRSFKLVAEKYSKFFDLYGDKVNEKIVNVYRRKIAAAIRKKDEDAYAANMKILKSLNFPQSEKVHAVLECQYYYSKNDWVNYAAKSVSYVEDFQIENPGELNSIAWDFYEKVSDKKMLEKAAEWSKKAVEIENNYANLDTHAAVLYKLGNKKEAQKYAELALKKAKEEGEDATETEELLKKIKALK
jgi:thiol-disulfide isomerase/thioredoxin